MEKRFEVIFVRRKRGNLGMGVTEQECITETFWFPNKVEDGFVELMLVTDGFDRVLNLKERVSVERLPKDYALKEDSSELYHKLRKTVPAG